MVSGGKRLGAGRKRSAPESKKVPVALYFPPRIAAMVRDLTSKRVAREIEPYIEKMHESLLEEKK